MKILTLNVCGLQAKLKAPDLEELCQNYNVVCFNETKLDDFDSVHISGFTALSLVNRKIFKAKSGGIAVFVKNDLFDYIVPLKGETENVLWFTFKDVVFSEPVLFGIVYVPPEGSCYSSIDIFDSIENGTQYILKIIHSQNSVAQHWINLCLNSSSIKKKKLLKYRQLRGDILFPL